MMSRHNVRNGGLSPANYPQQVEHSQSESHPLYPHHIQEMAFFPLLNSPSTSPLRYEYTVCLHFLLICILLLSIFIFTFRIFIVYGKLYKNNLNIYFLFHRILLFSFYFIAIFFRFLQMRLFFEKFHVNIAVGIHYSLTPHKSSATC